MSFVATKSTFIFLWLFVSLVTFCYAQHISSNSLSRGFRISNCGEDQFECEDKTCIQSELVCDGRVDCIDFSDETEFQCAKPELSCPDYTFRCTYGACIDKDLLCDGTVDCGADGSDEDPSGICRIENVPVDFPASKPGVIHEDAPGGGFGGSYNPVTIGKEQACLVPFPPKNGQCKLRRISENDDFEYVDPRTVSLMLNAGSHLVYTCDIGYKIRGNSVVHCSPQGKWSGRPVCIDVRCRPLASVSTMANCTYASGRVKPCTNIDAVRPKTRAQVSCRSGYRKEFSITPTETETVECKEDGKWVPEPSRCVPVCGVVNPGEKSGTFPWHATLYVQKNSSGGTKNTFRCDATVIQANLLLTAAHCLSDFVASLDFTSNSNINTVEVLESFFVLTGNSHQENDSLLHGSKFVKKHRVKNVHVTCSFQSMTSLHTADIALIELHELLEFSNTLRPACLDDTGSIQQFLDSTRSSQRPPILSSIQTLQTTTLQDTPYSQCVTLYNATQSPIYIKDDKFCTSYNDETYLCSDDAVNDGGGLVHKINDIWYLTGIVSQVVRVNKDVGEKMCRNNFDLLYTKASKHMTWIQQVISNLERSKPSFSTTTTTPASTSMTPITTPETTEMPETTPEPTTTPKSTLIQVIVGPRTPLVTADSCLVPPQPANGEWRLHSDFCEDGTDCDLSEDTMLALGSHLVYSCASGFRVETSTDVYCRADGNWSSIPVCTEIKCAPLNTSSIIATCSRFDEWVDCDSSMSPNTQATVSCRSGYFPQLTQSETVECNMNGVWEPNLSNCIPDCGATLRRSRLSVDGEITTEADNFPWHATLYVQRNFSKKVRKDVRCGATLIQANLLLTAAHCVYNDTTGTTEDPRNLFILMSNVHRHYDSPLHDFHSVRRGTIKNVYVHCKYRGLYGYYVSDIALLELQEPFEFFNIQLHPACLDFSGYNDEVLRPGASGASIGFGKTAIGRPSDILQTITVPHVSQFECKKSKILVEKEAFIRNDKFCAGHNNGTNLCLGDGGGGFFVQINGLWYIMGIMSVDLSVNQGSSETTCDGNAYTLYTKISDYMGWILDVMFHLERHKPYPPCSSDPISYFARFGV